MICEVAGLVGSVFTGPAIDGWYAGLIKPSFSPPSWIFAPVWTILFALMGISFFLIWKSDIFINPKERRRGIIIFFIQLVLNIFWSILFFGLRSPLGALVEIFFLWLAILATVIVFRKIKPIGHLAAWFLVPYLFWVSFAAYLNYSIWRLNVAPGRETMVYAEEKSSGFSNERVEKAITDYLLTQNDFSWKTQNNSHNFCAIENLMPEKELFPLYTWAYCGEYIIQNDELKILSGSSGPTEIDYPNELSFYDLGKFSHRKPGDGAHYAMDIEKIFPEEIWQKIFNFNRKNIIKKIEDIALINISGWESIKKAVDGCEVKSVWQHHDRTVKAELRNGGELSGVEPIIDEIMKLAVAAEPRCGKILMGTE